MSWEPYTFWEEGLVDLIGIFLLSTDLAAPRFEPRMAGLESLAHPLC